MEPRLVPTSSLPEQAECFPDTALAGFRVRNRFLAGAADGPTAAEVPDDGMYVEVLTCPPGESLGEHRHGHNEALFVLDGEWTVRWRAAEDAEHQTVRASRWDFVHVPANWWLSATNEGAQDAHLLVLAGRTRGCELPAWLTALVDQAGR